MALNAYQLISRVLPGRPFGDGRDGALTISSDTTQSLTVKSCSGTVSTKTLTIASNGFANGDIVIVHQTRGSGAGGWEVNRVVSGGGTTTLTLQENLQSTYTDSGASQAQVFEIPMYSNITINSGKYWTVPDWNGDTGGIMTFACTGTINGPGTIRGNGASGASGLGSPAGGVGGGFRGGAGRSVNLERYVGWQGEGTGGAGDRTNGRNENGGGSNNLDGKPDSAGAGGGGNGTEGQTGIHAVGITPGQGGSTAGNAEGSIFNLGGGGGGHAAEYANAGLGGASGGAGIIMFAAIIGSTLAISLNGGQGLSPNDNLYYCSGNGAGGSLLVQTVICNIGSGLWTANAGNKATATPAGEGRISIHYSGNISGTTSPTYTQVNDGRLVEQLAGLMFFV